MAERPLMFSAPMVRAILAGTKTVTRRPVTWRPKAFTPPQTEPTDHPGAPAYEPSGRHTVVHTHPDGALCRAPVIRCPALPGDRLWVRETWAKGLRGAEEALYLYRATYDGGLSLRWTPAIYMPQEASRITLEVTDVRVERLHRIDDADAEREGVRLFDPEHLWDPDIAWDPRPFTPLEVFSALWDRINGDGAWRTNPWVWRIEFRRLGGGVGVPRG